MPEIKASEGVAGAVVATGGVGAGGVEGGSSEEGDLSSVLRSASEGDEGAWRVVVDRYARRVYAMARSRVRSAELAEEVTQSVFVTVAATLGKGMSTRGSVGESASGGGGYEEQGKFESWLFRVVMNRVRDEARRAARQAVPTDPERLVGRVGDRGVAQDGGRLDGAVVGALRGALEQLPEADREVIELRHHGQMSFKAMADLLEEPLGTLLARHHRALKKLHAVLKDVLGMEVGEVWPAGEVDGSKGGRRREP